MSIKRVVSTEEFTAFLDDYNENKRGQVKVGEFSIMSEDVDMMRKHVSSLITKEDYYNRLEVLHKELSHKINKRAMVTDVN